MIRYAPTVGMVPVLARRGFTVMVKQTVKDMKRFARGRGDHFEAIASDVRQTTRRVNEL
jgi:hypothetical protein